MIGNEVSKPVSIMTNDFGGRSACAGSSNPAVINAMNRKNKELAEIGFALFANKFTLLHHFLRPWNYPRKTLVTTPFITVTVTRSVR